MRTDSRMLLYCIGAQKAATTWLHRQIGSLSDVTLPSIKEVHYWDTWRSPNYERFRERSAAEYARRMRPFSKDAILSRLSPRKRALRDDFLAYYDIMTRYDPQHSGYLGFLHRGALPGGIVGDFTPSYALLSQQTYAEMAALHENARFILILRDPVRRMVSGIQQQYRKRLGAAPISDTAAVDLHERAFEDALTQPGDHNFLRSDYRRTILALEGAVPPASIHIGFYETMFSDAEVQRLGAFMGLADFTPQIASKVHATKRVVYAPSEDMLKRARTAFGAVYEFVHERYGAEVPEAWGRP